MIALDKMIESKIKTLKEISNKSGLPVSMIKRMQESPEYWTYDLLADVLFGMGAGVSSIGIGMIKNSEEGEDHEDERIH